MNEHAPIQYGSVTCRSARHICSLSATPSAVAGLIYDGTDTRAEVVLRIEWDETLNVSLCEAWEW
jgi:hypothetical protein